MEKYTDARMTSISKGSFGPMFRFFIFSKPPKVHDDSVGLGLLGSKVPRLLR